MKRVDLDELRFVPYKDSFFTDGLSIVNTENLQSMIHELRLLRQCATLYINKTCQVCFNTTANHAHDDDCPVKALEEME